MKRSTRALRLLLLCAGLALGACGSCGGRAPSVADTAAEAARVRGVVDQFFDAAKRQDWDAAGELMSSDFELYTDDAAAFDKEAYVRLLKEDDLQTEYMELKDFEVCVSEDGRMAWCKYRGRFKTSSHGVESDVETAETLIFKREGAAWKINRAHASVKTLGAAAASLRVNPPRRDKN